MAIVTGTRPILHRYVDPLEVIWLSTATRLGLHIRRDPHVFSMTDGTGLLSLSTRDDLDADDTLAQMLFHEICHWVINGVETFQERDWGFPLDEHLDVREFATLRLQAWWADTVGLRGMLGPTGQYRQYYDEIPADPLEPLDDSKWERLCLEYARTGIERAQCEPFHIPVSSALRATSALRNVVKAIPIRGNLPSLWSAEKIGETGD